MRTRSVSRAYGGHTVPSAPTADARRPSLAYGGHIVPFAPMAFPTKAKCETAAFRSTGEAQRAQPWENSRGWSAFCLGKMPSFYLSCWDLANRWCNVYGCIARQGRYKRLCSGQPRRSHRDSVIVVIADLRHEPRLQHHHCDGKARRHGVAVDHRHLEAVCAASSSD